MADFEALRADIMWRFCLESEGSFLSQEEKCQQLDWRELWKRSLFSLSNRFGCTYKKSWYQWNTQWIFCLQNLNMKLTFVSLRHQWWPMAACHINISLSFNISLSIYHYQYFTGDLWQAVSDELFHILELFLTTGMHQTLQIIDWEICIMVDSKGQQYQPGTLTIAIVTIPCRSWTGGLVGRPWVGWMLAGPNDMAPQGHSHRGTETTMMMRVCNSME